MRATLIDDIDAPVRLSRVLSVPARSRNLLRSAPDRDSSLHAGAARLFPQRFRERQHERLRRVVDRHQRPGLKRRGRRDVQHAAARLANIVGQ